MGPIAGLRRQWLEPRPLPGPPTLQPASPPDTHRRRSPAPRLLGAATLGALLVLGCARRPDPPSPAKRQAAPPIFEEAAAAARLELVHDNGADGHFYYPEVVSGGAALLDYDGDGRLDVFLPQGGPLPPSPGDRRHRGRLFRNRGDGTFEDTTDSAGIPAGSYGSGAAAADFDRDGDVDLYVTQLGANLLLRNDGDGAFTDVTASAGVGDPGYSTSATFVDVDGDLWPDLYVCNYVVWSPAVEKPCLGRNGTRSYCSPKEYTPQADTLYRNNRDGTFSDVSEHAGIHAVPPAAGLGVVAADLDGDGKVDLYVANDQMANFLWRNLGDGTFAEEALERGAALDELGRAEAGMGVAVEDPDGDGDWDLFMVHLTGETDTFYRNLGAGDFVEVTDALRLGPASLPYTGFGTGFFDYDNDGRLDLFVANGKVSPGADLSDDFREPDQLFRGLDDGTYEDVSSAAGPALTEPRVSRASAFGDLDDDGDVDVLVVDNDGPVRLLRNQIGNRRHWLTVDTDGGTRFGRTAVGAIVEVDGAGGRRRRYSQPGYGYCTSNDPRVHFGLGDATSVTRLTVTWPDGTQDTLHDVSADQILRVRPGDGATGSTGHGQEE